jgi:2'-5' RNA ligase
MNKEMLSSIWLVPSEDDRAPFDDVINRLANKYDSIPFIPHITIWGAITAPIEVVEEASSQAIEGINPFTVEIEKLDYSEEWSKTLFAQLLMNENLEKIYKRLSDRLNNYTPYKLNPHLSLVYKEEMTELEKKTEIANIKLPKEFQVDRIVVTLPQDPVRKWKNISKWQTPIEFKLTKKSSTA